MKTGRKCFACDRKLGRNPALVTCSDAQDVLVGSECARLIMAGGVDGWQPPKGGPRLYALKFDPKGPMTYLEMCARSDRARGIKVTP